MGRAVNLLSMRKKFTLDDLESLNSNHYYEVKRVKRLHQSVYSRMNEFLDKERHFGLEWATTTDCGYLSLAFLTRLSPEKVVDMLNYAYRGRV